MTTDSKRDVPSAQSSERVAKERFVAAHWLKANAADFLEWVADSGAASRNASTMRDAIATAVHPSYPWFKPHTDLAACLPRVLHSCDDLTFSTLQEAIAYAGLHLLDRYGRVTQVLEYLMRIGRLPIRKKAVKVLEVGAGPAPALYAVRDFYSMLRAWPQVRTAVVADVEVSHSIERGEAWDSVLHHISERLMLARDGVQNPVQSPMV